MGCWRRLLRVPWTARRSNQSIRKEISPVCSLEGMMLKLKFQYHLMATWCDELSHLKRPWCWERLKAGGEADNRGWDGWMASLNQWTWVWVNSRSWWCHPTISCSVIRFSSCLQSFPALGSFQMSRSSNQVAKVLEFQLQHQYFQWIFRTHFL